MKKLNLGSGLDYRQGWINVELNKKLKADLYFDLRKDFPLEKASFDYVLAQDILEHFTKEDAKRFIKECYRVLKVGGVLELRFPNILQIISQFRKDTEVLIKFLYGNTEVAGELGSHKFGYTEKTIRKLLKESDFWVESIEKKTTNFVVVAKKVKRRKAVFSVVFSGLDSGAWGGAEKFLWQLSEEIKTVGVSSSFLVVESSVFCQKLQSDNRKVSTMPMRMDIIGGLKGLIKFFLFLPYATYLLWKKLKQTKTKGEVILVLPGISDKIILTPLARILKIPVVWLEFSPLSDVFKVNFGIPKALYRLVGFLCDTVFIPKKNCFMKQS